MNERFDHPEHQEHIPDQEKGANREPEEAYLTLESILVARKGYVRDLDCDGAQKAVYDFINTDNDVLARFLREKGLLDLEIDMAELTATWTAEGLPDLSEVLSYHGGAQAVIVNHLDKEEVIDVKGVESDAEDMAVLVDSQGRRHSYSQFRALLIPKGKKDE